jgi:hypothetical protein
MAIGLGQMLIGGLLGNEIGKRGGLSGLLGGVNQGNTGRVTDQDMSVMSKTMPTQTAQAPQQQGSGFMQGISNMLGNPTDEQIARMGIGFNSMRLRPDDNLAKSFENRIDRATANKQKNASVEALIKMGKTNLAALVKSGAMPLDTAMTLAFKEGKGDTTGTITWMESFRGKGTSEQDSLVDSYIALMESAKGDPTAIRTYVEMFSNDFGVGQKNLKDTTSGIQVQQQDGTVMGVEMKEGQKYTVVTDEFGKQTVNIIDGAFGESESMKYERELTQEMDADDRKLAVDRSREAYLEASSAMDSVQKYQNIQQVLKNPDGTFNEDAITGWIADMFPSFKNEQAIIRSTANLMGIDVINMATFGALSEREMKMAMATNLDVKLGQEELYKQIVEMVEARRKLAGAMLERSQRISELGSYDAYKAEQTIERQGHLKSRYRLMNDDVRQEIMIGQYNYDTRNNPEITYEQWDSANERTGYDIWNTFNFNSRASLIANMDGMTSKKFNEIMGNTEFAANWWATNVGAD